LVIQYKFTENPPTPNAFLTYFQPNIQEVINELAQKYSNIPSMLKDIDQKLFAPLRT
jgi:hypothetical protein